MAGRKNRPRHAKRSAEADSTEIEASWVKRLREELARAAEQEIREPVEQLPEIKARIEARQRQPRGKHRRR